ncbi:MAG: thioesterase [Bacteroidetes bacterium MedPE-SWsnd-G1]|nr:MAG: thioesterase [Bacteroidetes bacterium MedPE-SWsnd-G1]
MTKILESKVRVRFQDCDPFNHLNNSSYIDYFFNAREDQLLKDYDINIYEHAQKTGKGWVVVSNQISYFKPALLTETVTVETQIINFSQRSIQVELRMFDESKTQLKAIMWSKFAYFDIRNQKGAEHSEDFMKLFSEAHAPIEAKTFEERMTNILKGKL